MREVIRVMAAMAVVLVAGCGGKVASGTGTGGGDAGPTCPASADPNVEAATAFCASGGGSCWYSPLTCCDGSKVDNTMCDCENGAFACSDAWASCPACESDAGVVDGG